AGQLEADPQLEWSPAVIGLCKAFEAEVVRCILRPLADLASHADLRADEKDKDLGRVAAFCANPTRKAPELGVFSHFLQTAIHSQQRRETSPLLANFLKLTAVWTGSNWLLGSDGLYRTLALLIEIRNRAAHTDELGKDGYLTCRSLVI